MIHPILLGSGQRLFDLANNPTSLSLIASTSTPKSVILASYRPVEQLSGAPSSHH